MHYLFTTTLLLILTTIMAMAPAMEHHAQHGNHGEDGKQIQGHKKPLLASQSDKGKHGVGVGSLPQFAPKNENSNLIVKKHATAHNQPKVSHGIGKYKIHGVQHKSITKGR